MTINILPQSKAIDKWPLFFLTICVFIIKVNFIQKNIGTIIFILFFCLHDKEYNMTGQSSKDPSRLKFTCRFTTRNGEWRFDQ